MTAPLDQLVSALSHRYRIERELGAGGMATVYLAEDTKLGRRVAVKVLRPEFGAAIGPERFLREIRITAKLDHPHILTLHDSDEVAGFLYYVMPYVEGQSLRDLLSRTGRLRFEHALRITEQVASALDYAHRQGVIHRDVKPENILLKDGEAFVADFGIALALSHATGQRLTETGLSLGTPYYMSPEQTTSEHIDGRSDEYALACVVHEMLTGKPPFQGPNAQAVLRQQMVADPPKVSLPAGQPVPAGVQQALLKALAKQPDDRYATIREFSQALAAAPVPRLRLRILASTVAMLGVVAIGGYLLRSGGSRAAGGDGAAIAQTAIPRLAVLAFENLGAPEDGFFAQGITEELNSQLSGLRGLAVISRSSASMYTASGKSAREIGAALGADYVLDGTVRWRPVDGESEIRVTPTLTRVRDDTQVWSSQFDRPFEEAPAIQSEIATQVVAELDLVLSAAERETMGRGATRNPLAYEAYLRGLDILPEGHAAEQGYRDARTILQQAVNLDPSFAVAWVALADAHIGLYWYGYDTRSARLDSALHAIRRAQEISPNLHEARIALGDYYYRQREYDRALAEFSTVFSERPNDVRVLRAIGFLWRRQGLFEQGLETIEKAVQLDPLDAYFKLELSWTHMFLGSLDRAFQLVEEARTVDPTEQWLYLIKVILLWNRAAAGDLSLARQELESFPNARSSYPAWFWILQEQYEGRFEAALERIQNLTVDAIVLQAHYEPVELLRGLTLRLLDRKAQSRAELELAAKRLERDVEANPGDFRLHLSLGLAYAGLQRRAEAMRAGQAGVALMPLSKDALVGTDVLYSLMRLYAVLGEEDLALATMARLLAVPNPYGGYWFTKNPEFEALRRNPRFWTILGDSPPSDS